MRLKLMIENFKHHFVLSIFIILCMIFISGAFIITLECDNFMLHVSYEEYKHANNDYDIIIKSNTGLYLGNVNGENGEYENSYSRKNALYNTSLVVQANNQETIVEVFEGENADIYEVFHIKNLDKNETVITRSLANSLQITTGDQITLFLDSGNYTYIVSDIIEEEGLVIGKSIIVTGDKISSYYNLGISGLCNLILLEVKMDENELDIYNYLKDKFSIYSVNYINDLEYISSLHSSTIDTICLLMIIIMIPVLFLLVKIYRNKIKKQIDYFEINGKKNYYLSYQILVWSIVGMVSFIVGLILANISFEAFYDLFNCKVPFVISIKSYLIVLVILILIVVFLLLPKNKFNKMPKKVYLVIKYAILLIEIILLIIFSKHVLFGLFLIILVFTLIIYLIDIVFKSSKRIKSYLVRIYIYNFGRKSIISKLILILEVIIIVGVSLGMTVVNYHLKEYDNFTELLKIDSVVATKYQVDTKGLFDEVRVDNNAIISNQNINNLFSFSSEQLTRYTDFSLTNEELIKYESNEKYIILPLSYRNELDLKIGDKIQVNILNKDKKESFEVLKFVDILYDKMAIVNRSDVMYFGYILRDNNTYQDILTTFDNTSYRLYNISNVIQANSRIHKNVVTVIKYVIIAILFILILFSIYLGYLEYKYQEDSLRKLKYLGCSFDKWIKPAIIKLIISIMICLICGFIWTSIILHYIDIILIYFHTIFHISFNYKIILISSLFSMICLIIGFISACYHFKKL